MALIKCPECGKEISDKARNCIHCGIAFKEDNSITKICNECGREINIHATECPFCGCPAEEDKSKLHKAIMNIDKLKIDINKIVILLSAIIIVAVAGLLIYNIKVIQPRKLEAQNKATYEEAIELLEKGKYDDGQKLLETIVDYENVVTILDQIKWESYVYDCINDWKLWLKNPDSFTLYEVSFFYDDKSHGIYSSLLGEVDFSYPAIIFRSGAQNGFGGNTTGYELFYYIKDTGYTCMGSCEYLDKEEYYDDEGELKDEEDGAMEVLLCTEINELKEQAEEVGTVDMERVKTLIKNDSYSTIKIAE